MECAIDLYADALQSFSKETLAAAYRQVKANHRAWGWPEVGYFTKACREIEERKEAPVAPSSEKKYPWQVRAEYAAKIINEFMGKFPLNALAVKAKQEGWYAGRKGLRNYAMSHAELQAQLIAGQANLMFDSWAWGYNSWHENRSKDCRIDLQAEIAVTRSIMAIEVTLPEIAEVWMRAFYSEVN